MTDPTPAPSTQELDQAVIDAGRALAEAQRATPRDPDAIDAARSALLEARAARWPDG
jgi:hypothetical protein